MMCAKYENYLVITLIIVSHINLKSKNKLLFLIYSLLNLSLSGIIVLIKNSSGFLAAFRSSTSFLYFKEANPVIPGLT